MSVFSGKCVVMLWNTSLQHVVKTLHRQKESEIYDELLYRETYLTDNISGSQVVGGWEDIPGKFQ